MSHQQDPFWSSGAICGGNYEVGQSPTNEQSDCFLDSSVTPPNCWLQIYRSLGNGTSEMDDFQDILGVLMDVSGCATSSVQANSSTPLKSEFAREPCKEQSNAAEREPGERVLRRCRSDAREVSEELTRKQNDRLKRTRSAEVHKMSERRRRSRINNRLKVLQELIPNCNKLDRVSVLDHAINYLKGLKLQIEMMSAGQGFIFEGAYISSGLQSTQVSQFSRFLLPIGPNCNWAMCYSTSLNHPRISIPSATLHPSLLSGSIGLCQMPAGPGNNAVPQVAIPFSHPQQLSTSAML